MFNEAKQTQIKRKYTERFPSHSSQIKTPVRNKILSYIHEEEFVTKEQMLEFLKQFNESEGRHTSIQWVRRQIGRYIKETRVKNEKGYKLTRLGRRVLNRTTINESERAKLNESLSLYLESLNDSDKEQTIGILKGSGALTDDEVSKIGSELGLDDEVIKQKIDEMDDTFINMYKTNDPEIAATADLLFDEFGKKKIKQKKLKTFVEVNIGIDDKDELWWSELFGEFKKKGGMIKEEEAATMGNAPGMGNTNTPSLGNEGSGDCFDDDCDEDKEYGIQTNFLPTYESHKASINHAQEIFEDASNDFSEDDVYGVYFIGGSIGESRGVVTATIGGSFAYLVRGFKNADDAKKFAKERRSKLSPGEKKYYGMKYAVRKFTKGDIKLIKLAL